MPYRYQEERPYVFTDEGQRDLLSILYFCRRKLAQAGAVSAGKAIGSAIAVGDTFHLIACIDRLVELGELKEVTKDISDPYSRIFVSGRGE